MKKYILIKQYPDSPIIGTIISAKNPKKDNWFYSETGRISVFGPEKFPDFWSPLEERDFEILEFKHKYGGLFTKNYSKDKEKFCQTIDGSEYTEDQLLKDEQMSISKVKRMSDGNVFSIEEKIWHKFTCKSDVKGVIKAFSISVNDKNTINVNFRRGVDSYTLWNNINQIRKCYSFSLEDIEDAYPAPKDSPLYNKFVENLKAIRG
jgi:hypothetical protein